MIFTACIFILIAFFICFLESWFERTSSARVFGYSASKRVKKSTGWI